MNTVLTVKERLAQAVKAVHNISYTLIAILRVIDETPNDIIVVVEKIPVMLRPHEVSDEQTKAEKVKRALRGGLRFICRQKPGTELVRYLVYDPKAKEAEIDLKDAYPSQAP